MRLGIDFGTTFSSAAVVRENLMLVKEPLKLGYSFPSSVALTRRGELVVGQAAENIRRLHPRSYRGEFKRDLGKAVPLRLGERKILPEDLVAEVLRALKLGADQMLNSSLTAAVITVPATYDGHKHDLMERAAEAAGFDGRQVTLLEEPVAAALYHARSSGTGQGMADGETMLVYDLGGGTFDAALVRKTAASYEPLGLPKGLPYCGGMDFDREIYKDVEAQCGAVLGDLLDRSRRDEEALAARLAVVEFCRDIKHQLSAAAEVEARLPVGASRPIYRLTRDAFNEMIRPLIDGTIEACRAVLDSAGIERQDVSGVLLVGGSCRIRYVQQVVEREFGRPVLSVDEPELAVCQGAAIYGATLEEEWEPPRPPRRNVIVSPVPRRGQYTTISGAIRHAAPGAQIQVQPGVYREGLILDKPVEIVGDGHREDIIIESVDRDCIMMQCDRATVRGMTLRCLAGTKGKEYYGVDIAQGQLTLEHCDITSDSLSCVAIHGAADPVISHCQIHDGKQAGVYVYENGRGQLEHCDIFGNALAGVEIEQGGNPTIRRCQIFDGKQSGVYVRDNGAGRLEQCHIFKNARRGVEISHGGNPVLENCKIYESRHSGIWVHDQGKGELRNCELWGNGIDGAEVASGGSLSDGVSISTGGAPILIECTIRDSDGDGIWVFDNGTGTVEDCDIFSNGSAGVGISLGGNPLIRRCTIRDGKAHGVYANDDAKGTLEDCKIFSNRRLEVKLSAKSTTIIRGGEIGFFPAGGFDTLRTLLQRQQWDAADEETIRLIRAVSGDNCIDSEAKAKALSYDLLHVLEFLWVSSGGGKLKDRNFVSEDSRGVTTMTSFGLLRELVNAAVYGISTWIEWRLNQVGLM